VLTFVGHTIQWLPELRNAHILSACGGQIVRIDVGMSEGCCDAEPEILEITQLDSGQEKVSIIFPSGHRSNLQQYSRFKRLQVLKKRQSGWLNR